MEVSSQYEAGLRKLRFILLTEGFALLVLSLLFGRINGFIYIFVMLTAVFLFCQINLKHTYQILIVIALFLLIRQIIQFLMFLFYRPAEQKHLNPAKPIIMYSISIVVIMKLILVTWRHYENKLLLSINSGQNSDFMEDF